MSAPADLLLTINTGSSSLKAALYACSSSNERVLAAEAKRIALPDATMIATDAQGGSLLSHRGPLANHAAALEQLLTLLDQRGLTPRIVAVGHRFVHGGLKFTEPTRIDNAVLSRLRELVELAPEHLPQAIEALEVLRRRLPTLPQVACFDTAFHRTLPRRARLLAVPHELSEAGVVRFGFHGLSYEYLVGQLRVLDGERAGGRAVLAHLGNGASLAAVRQGVSIDTSMGFTPAAGLVMSTRTGDLDPGVLVYLLTSRGLAPADVNQLVNKQSGLLGVSGSSGDMRDLLERRDRDPRAAAAVELFCYQAKKFIAGFAAALGGLDTLVFSGGIGEHAAEVRAEICADLEFLGIRLDAERNAAHAGLISAADQSVAVRVIVTDEDSMIAQHTRQLLLT